MQVCMIDACAGTQRPRLWLAMLEDQCRIWAKRFMCGREQPEERCTVGVDDLQQPFGEARAGTARGGLVQRHR